VKINYSVNCQVYHKTDTKPNSIPDLNPNCNMHITYLVDTVMATSSAQHDHVKFSMIS